jgi:hypothetical protein
MYTHRQTHPPTHTHTQSRTHPPPPTHTHNLHKILCKKKASPSGPPLRRIPNKALSLSLARARSLSLVCVCVPTGSCVTRQGVVLATLEQIEEDTCVSYEEEDTCTSRQRRGCPRDPRVDSATQTRLSRSLPPGCGPGGPGLGYRV